MPLELLYSDDNYVAINKPSGLLVHRTALDKHATEFAVQRLRDQIGHEVFPCHRIDRPTSGVLLFALNSKAAQHAQTQFAERSVRKTYHAITRGWTPNEGFIDYALRSEDSPSKTHEAQTRYCCLRTSEIDLPVGNYSKARFSLVELFPQTGRKHQLRRHMAHLRHPIIGDTRHGDGTQNQFIRQHFDCHRLLLHACSLQIQPLNADTPLTITANYDDTFSRLVNELKLTPKHQNPASPGTSP